MKWSKSYSTTAGMKPNLTQPDLSGALFGNFSNGKALGNLQKSGNGRRK
ncbi:hypothetical protein NG800_005205 [Epilithonimonas ginsengisoli]|uniref:Lasso RiPP family leader peptide-containing protein n=1 Tax=Epilithonimonas ginsengisoli TaxID=1245592 RepID=A0ABU4JF36_9FLAO|nr:MULTISPECIES: hypothetical protein [Chryseobacterium group]MBV6879658.1 hypothetical protein [Epilithonimonas sp. FP105]MDW8548295.1 hypothetical protein [Epilithonimonas ginsengisoli]